MYDQLANVLRAQGHTVIVGGPDEQGNVSWVDNDQVIGVTSGVPVERGLLGRLFILRPILRRLRLFQFMSRIRRMILQLQPEVVQVNKCEFAFLLPWGIKRIRFVYDVRQLGLWGRDLWGRIRNAKQVFRIRLNSVLFYDVSCFGSVSAAKRALGNSWQKWAVVTPIGVSKLFLEIPSARFSIPGGDVTRFVYIGTISRLRNIECILDAVSILRRHTSTFSLTIMGPGDDRDYYKRCIIEKGIGSFVKVEPPIPYEEIPAFLLTHDIALAFVPDVIDWQFQPTLKVLEYIALGIPIIASNNPPNRELVKQGQNGVLSENTPQDYAAAMLRFVRDHNLLVRYKRLAMTARSGLTWDDVAQIHLEKVYLPDS